MRVNKRNRELPLLQLIGIKSYLYTRRISGYIKKRSGAYGCKIKLYAITCLIIFEAYFAHKMKDRKSYHILFPEFQVELDVDNVQRLILLSSLKLKRFVSLLILKQAVLAIIFYIYIYNIRFITCWLAIPRFFISYERPACCHGDAKWNRKAEAGVVSLPLPRSIQKGRQRRNLMPFDLRDRFETFQTLKWPLKQRHTRKIYFWSANCRKPFFSTGSAHSNF